MRFHRTLLTVALLMISPACIPTERTAAQTTLEPGASQIAHPKKQIDIGAAEAPLNDAQRVDLDNAVAKHNYAGEKAVVDSAIAEHPDSFELLVMGGRLAYLEKHPKDAVDALERADKIKPLSEADRLTLAISYEFAGMPSRSEDEFVKLTKLAPTNSQYPFLLGRMNRKNEHLDLAVENFKKAIQIEPTNVRAFQELAQTQEALGLEEQARNTYESGAAVNRKLPHPWEWPPLDLAIVHLKADELPEAEKLIRESLQYKPRFGWGHYYLGQLYQKQGNNSDAMTEYKEAVFDDPRLRQAWLAMARQFKRQGDDAEADRALAIYKKLEDQENAAKKRTN